MPVGLIERLATFTLQPTILEKIKQGQETDPYLKSLKIKIQSRREVYFHISSDSTIRYNNKLQDQK